MVFRSPQSKAQGPQEAPESDQLTTSGIPLKIEAVSKIFPGRAAIVEALRPVKVDIIDLPRPHLLENQMVVDRASQITSVLREEISANTQGGSLQQWQGGVRISNPENCTLSLFKQEMSGILDSNNDKKRFSDKFFQQTLLFLTGKQELPELLGTA